MCFIIQFGNRFLYTDCRIIRLTDDKAKASQYELTTEGYLKSLKEINYGLEINQLQNSYILEIF